MRFRKNIQEENRITPNISGVKEKSLKGSVFDIYNNVTGKRYEHQSKIVKGKITIPGKLLSPSNIKHKSLVGKKEGSAITIAD